MKREEVRGVHTIVHTCQAQKGYARCSVCPQRRSQTCDWLVLSAVAPLDSVLRTT